MSDVDMTYRGETLGAVFDDEECPKCGAAMKFGYNMYMGYLLVCVDTSWGDHHTKIKSDDLGSPAGD